MPQNPKEVNLHLPLETLINTLCELPDEDLIEVKRRIQERLQDPESTLPHKHILNNLEDTEFWKTDLGREILSENGLPVSLEDILRITSKIKNPLASEIIAEREER